uniref:Disease resistance N-terminal domain-containing protein n=1 Tax=Aegilops tauschii subsp. strangulata TaxID=200361 RepID=A0A453A0R1_AEGTS
MSTLWKNYLRFKNKKKRVQKTIAGTNFRFSHDNHAVVHGTYSYPYIPGHNYISMHLTRYARTNRISTLVENQAELVDFPAGPMGSLLPKLLEFLSDEYNYLHADCKKDVEYVYNELVGMQAALHKVAEVPQDQQLDSVVKLWTEEVNDLSYQVDNTVDSFLARFWASEFGMSPNLRSQKQQLPRKTSGAKKKGNGQKKRAR